MKNRIAFFNIAHPDYKNYFNNMCIKLAKEAIDNLKAKNIEVIGSEEPIMNERNALDKALAALSEDIDCFIIFVGTWIECSVPVVIIREMEHLPFVIWGFPMMEIDGKREQLGSLAGELVLNGSLRRVGYKFKEIIGFPDNEKLIESVLDYIIASRAKKLLRRSRIGLVGYMSMSMYSSTFDHLLMRTKIGPEIVHIDTYTLLENGKRISPEKLQEAKQIILNTTNKGDYSQSLLEKTSCLYASIRKVLEDYQLDGINIKCQYELSKLYGCIPCVPLSILTDEGYICACEGDIPTQITMFILKLLSNEIPTYGDLLDFQENNVYLSSCGFAPFSLSNSKCDKKINMSCFEGFNGLVSSTVLKPGKVTIARLSEKIGNYELIYSIGEALESQLRQNIMPAVSINFDQNITSSLYRLASQHFALIYGNIEKRILDFIDVMNSDISVYKI